MIEITKADSRYEVRSADRHWEAFESKLAAHAAALALAAEVELETGTVPQIAAPWVVHFPVKPHQ